MIWGRKRKPQGNDQGPPEATPPTADMTSVPEAAQAVHVPIDFVEAEAPLDLARDWEALGGRAWEILKRRRMHDIWPDDGTRSEFDRYLELLRRSPAEYREEVFIGLKPPEYTPVFVPRAVFKNHAYVLGGSGSGKTSHALAQLLIQLSEEYVDRQGEHQPRPPILIMDLKQNGDRYLRALAQRTAAERQQSLQFFSNDPEYQSLHFDPLYSLRTAQYPIKMLETLLRAFSMIYPEGYGSDFFTNEQRVQLLEILYQDRPTTLSELVQFVYDATRKKGGNTDARGLYSALASLERAMHVHAGQPSSDPAQRVDFDRFFDRREVLYVHLDTRGMSLLSRDIGKLMLFALLETASQREKQGQRTQAFVFIDEFHRLAARNVVEMLEDARGAGLGFILAHQSSASLQTRDADLYGILFENCCFKQCLTLEDPRVIDLFRTVAGRTSERHWGGSLSKAEASQADTGWSRQNTEGRSISKTSGIPFPTVTRGTQHSDAAGRAGGAHTAESTTQSDTWQDELTSALTPEMVQQVNDTNLLSLVHVKGAGPDTLTPTGGTPTLVHGLYPFLHKRPLREAGAAPDHVTGPYAAEMEREPWPLKERFDPEEYYRKARPDVDRSAVAALSKRGKSRGKAAPVGASRVLPPDAGDDGVRRELEQRLLTLAERMATHMLHPAPSVETFARQHETSVRDVLAIATELGLPARAKGDRLRLADVARIEEKLRERSQPRKDNGPQAGPVV